MYKSIRDNLFLFVILLVLLVVLAIIGITEIKKYLFTLPNHTEYSDSTGDYKIVSVQSVNSYFTYDGVRYPQQGEKYI